MRDLKVLNFTLELPSDVKLTGELVSGIGNTVSVECQVTLDTVRVELCTISDIGVPSTVDDFGGAGVLSRNCPSIDQVPLSFASAAPKNSPRRPISFYQCETI